MAKKKWGQEVAKSIKRKGTEGTFTAAAKSGESTRAHVSRVLAPGSTASTKQKRKAQFLRNIASMEHGGVAQEDGIFLLHEGEKVIPNEKTFRVGANKTTIPLVESGAIAHGGVTEHPEKQAHGSSYPGVTRTASPVRDAKCVPGAARKAIDTQVNGDVRTDPHTEKHEIEQKHEADEKEHGEYRDDPHSYGGKLPPYPDKH